MGLIQNGFLNGSPMSFLCGTSFQNANVTRNGDTLGKLLNFYTWLDQVSGIPSGVRPPEAYLMPFNDGGMAFQFLGEPSILDVAITGKGNVSFSSAGTATFEIAVSQGQIARFSFAGTGTFETLVTGLARAGISINVSELTQDDVVLGVIDAKIDGVFSLRDYLKIIGAALAGKASNTPSVGGSTVVFRNLNDTVDTIIGEVDSNKDRTSLAYNLGD